MLFISGRTNNQIEYSVVIIWLVSKSERISYINNIFYGMKIKK